VGQTAVGFEVPCKSAGRSPRLLLFSGSALVKEREKQSNFGQAKQLVEHPI
jgi:hypothetical protein